MEKPSNLLDEKYYNRAISLIFIISYLCLLFVYYKERLFGDSAFYLFNIINYEDYYIPHFRFSNIIVQFLPLLFTKLGFSLKFITISFSISYFLFYFFLHLMNIHYGKTFFYALLIPFILFASSSHLFFWIVSELQLGIASSLTAFVILINKQKKIDLFFSIILILISIFFHPFLILLNFIILISYIIYNYTYKKINLFEITLFSSVLFSSLLLKLLFFRSEYESEIIKLNSDFFSINYITQLLIYLFYHKFILLLAIFLTAFFLWKYEKKLILVLFLCLAIVLIIFVNLFYPAIYDNFYSDNLYLPVYLVILIFWCFIADRLNIYKKSLFYSFLVLLIMLSFSIIHTSTIYTERIEFAQKCIDYSLKLNTHKIIIESDYIGKMRRNWSYPTESILYTTLHNESKKTITVVNKDIFDEVASKYTIDSTKIILSLWNVINCDGLNKKYFSIPESNYKLVRNE